MGQRCCGRLSPLNQWRRRQRRHRAFEFAPKRSWKYKDANLLDEAPNEGALDDSPPPLSGATPPGGRTSSMTNVFLEEEEEEEVNTGEIRRSGLLAFDEDSDKSEEEGVVTTPIHATSPSHHHSDNSRDRSFSNDSQKIGRFEVTTIGEGEELLSTA